MASSLPWDPTSVHTFDTFPPIWFFAIFTPLTRALGSFSCSKMEIMFRSEIEIPAYQNKEMWSAVVFPKSQLFVQLRSEDMMGGSGKIFHKFIHCLPPSKCIGNSVIHISNTLPRSSESKARGRKQELRYFLKVCHWALYIIKLWNNLWCFMKWTDHLKKGSV